MNTNYPLIHEVTSTFCPSISSVHYPNFHCHTQQRGLLLCCQYTCLPTSLVIERERGGGKSSLVIGVAKKKHLAKNHQEGIRIEDCLVPSPGVGKFHHQPANSSSFSYSRDTPVASVAPALSQQVPVRCGGGWTLDGGE